MKLAQLIVDYVQLGYEISFQYGILNLCITVRKRSKEGSTEEFSSKSSWLPFDDHCDEGTIVNCIMYMIGKIDGEKIIQKTS